MRVLVRCVVWSVLNGGLLLEVDGEVFGSLLLSRYGAY